MNREISTAVILRPSSALRLDGGVVGDHVFPAVSGDVIIDAPLQRFQQRGLPVIAPSRDEGNSLFDSHAPQGAMMRQFKVTARLSGETKGIAFCMGRSETPLSLGKIEPSATKATKPSPERLFRINC